MSETPALLAYGTIDTQFRVTCEDRADGGIMVTIPTTTWAYVKRRTPPSHPIVILFTIGWYFVERIRNRPLPPRAVIELTAEHLSITEPQGESNTGTATRTWSLSDVGEVRPNRYAKGLYVRIPGKDNFDMLGDLDRRLVEHVGNRLSAALERLRRDAGVRG
jgi:hypothetical protein